MNEMKADQLRSADGSSLSALSSSPITLAKGKTHIRLRDTSEEEEGHASTSSSSSSSNSSTNSNSILDGGGSTSPATTTATAHMDNNNNNTIKALPSESRKLTLRIAEDDLDDEAGMGEQSGSQGFYPPMTDEDLESKKVEEHLRHLDLIEKQRRKAAREARNAKATSSVVGDVTRRASLLIFNRSNSVRANGRPSSDVGRRGSWAIMRSRDSEDTLPGTIGSGDGGGSPATTAVSDRSSTGMNGNGHNIHHRSNSSTSTATAKSVATARSGPNNPFSTRYHPGDSESVPLDDPFDPPKDGYPSPSLQLQPIPHSPRTLGHIKSLSQDEKDDNERTPRKIDIKGKGKERLNDARPRSVINLPPAAMLVDDLPQPRMPTKMTEPESGQGHWRRTTDQSQHEQARLEEEERDRTHGRWWTDWFCGCREAGPDTYLRNEQAARTNPFE